MKETNLEVGSELTVGASFEAEIPFVATVSGSTELSLSSSAGHTWGEEESETQTWTRKSGL